MDTFRVFVRFLIYVDAGLQHGLGDVHIIYPQRPAGRQEVVGIAAVEEVEERGVEDHVVLGLKSQRRIVPLIFIIVIPAVGVIVAGHDPERLVRIFGLADRVIQDAGQFLDAVSLSLISFLAGLPLVVGHPVAVFTVLEVDGHDVDRPFDAIDVDLVPSAVVDDDGVRLVALHDQDAVDGETGGDDTGIVGQSVRGRCGRTAGNDEMILVAPAGA